MSSGQACAAVWRGSWVLNVMAILTVSYINASVNRYSTAEDEVVKENIRALP
jgi:hypothetical protein